MDFLRITIYYGTILMWLNFIIHSLHLEMLYQGGNYTNRLMRFVNKKIHFKIIYYVLLFLSCIVLPQLMTVLNWMFTYILGKNDLLAKFVGLSLLFLIGVITIKVVFQSESKLQ
jgi:putative flippase GtrA